MKKSLILVISLIVCTFVQAQWKVEPRVGLSLSGFSDGDYKMKFGFKGGLNAEYEFTELFALRPGLFFTMKGASNSKNPFNQNSKNAIRLSYLDIPICGAFRFGITNSFKISLNPGICLSFLVNDKPEIPDSRSFDTGVQAGIDFIFNDRFVFGGEAQYGLIKLSKESGAPHVYNYSLMIGYRF